MKTQLPRDIHDNPIPVLAPYTPHDVTITGSQQSAPIALDEGTSALHIYADATVRFAFGDANVAATATSFKLHEGIIREIAIPHGTTHMRFYGENAATAYVEEMR